MGKEQKNIAHMVIFSIGIIVNLINLVSDRYSIIQKYPFFTHLLHRCVYGIIMGVLLVSLLITRQNHLNKYAIMHGCMQACAIVGIFLTKMDNHLIFERIAKMLMHYIMVYHIYGMILSFRWVPIISKIAQELSFGTHWDLKLGYLALNISIYATHTYSTHFFNKQLKLPVANYGYLGSMSMFYICCMFIGPIADRNMMTKKIAILFSIVSTIVYTTFLMIKNTDYGNNLFVICSLFSLYIIILSPVFPLYDVLVLSYLAKEYKEKATEERKEIFSRIRMWASIGHAVSGLVVTYFYNIFNMSKSLTIKDNSSTQFMVLVMIVILMTCIFVGLTTFSLEEKTDITKKKEEVIEKKEGSSSLLLNKEFLFLLFVVTAVGATRGTSSYYLVSYTNKCLGLDFSKISSVMCIRTFSEMLILYYSKPLLKYFGYHWLLLFSLAAATIREFIYGHLTQSVYIPYIAIGVEMLKGISASCLIFSAVNIADMLAGPPNKALAQTCYSACYNGISLLISSLIGIGALRIFKDFRSLFMTSSILGFTCCIIVILKYGLINRQLNLFRPQKQFLAAK
ncbi:hypothetical protein NEOKW01_2085 [Nematocida sp. AWRm80]|nr:hypothetical protein NEOKW01_2085 [Nematocida sp. AWRm80]